MSKTVFLVLIDHGGPLNWVKLPTSTH